MAFTDGRHAPEPYRTILLGLLAVSVIALTTSPMLVISSVMIFDAPGAIDSPITRAVAYGVIVTPAVALAGLIPVPIALRWFYRATFAVPVLIVGGWLLFNIAAHVALDRVCGGSFGCGKPEHSYGTRAPASEPQQESR